MTLLVCLVFITVSVCAPAILTLVTGHLFLSTEPIFLSHITDKYIVFFDESIFYAHKTLPVNLSPKRWSLYRGAPATSMCDRSHHNIALSSLVFYIKALAVAFCTLLVCICSVNQRVNGYSRPSPRDKVPF